MTIQETLQAKLSRAFDGPLAGVPRPLLVRQEARGYYDPSTGSRVRPEATEAETRGVLVERTKDEVMDSDQEPTETWALILQHELSLWPKMGDHITDTSPTGLAYIVVAIKPDPANAHWALKLRSV